MGALMMSYENPVWHEYFADPFVLRSGNTFYAYGTGATGLERDGKAFPVLRSTDLNRWHYVGGALKPVEGFHGYWAPEVAFSDGLYYMFYSGNDKPGDEGHRVRVARSENPEGPFEDMQGPLMGDLGFTIDANPFFDTVSKEWFLFFATDYLADEPHGTGIGVVRLRDMTTVAGEPVIVARATQAWQLYEENRQHMGKRWKQWYTVEGPCVVYHQRRYWCLYSGGRWSGERYGVGFAVAEHPMGPWRDDFAVHGPTVLRGIPGKVIGPGHTSVTQSPDGRGHILIYHAWDEGMTRRRMCIDPLIWTADGPRCDGPSVGPRLLYEPDPAGTR
jgi:beta-xylosidase